MTTPTHHTHLGKGIPAVKGLIDSVHLVNGSMLVPHHPIAQCLLQGLGGRGQEPSNDGHQLWVADGERLVIICPSKLDVPLTPKKSIQ